jgi:ComF family protein
MMANGVRKKTKSIHHRASSRLLESSNSYFSNKLNHFQKIAGPSVMWMVQAVADFLIDDRCVLCGELSHLHAKSNDNDRLFSGYLTRMAYQRLFGFLQIENHPICRACIVDFDETHSPGVIRVVEESAGIGRNATVISPFMTNDSVLKLVHLIKFSGYTALVPLVARPIQAAYQQYQSQDLEPCILLPVPMHRKQEKERGFNQAELIARELAHTMKIPLQTEDLQRHRLGMRQSLTPRAKRPANVQGAFSVRKSSVEGKHALLVDDLVTSGATAAACSNVLLLAGAESVTVICLGRSL